LSIEICIYPIYIFFELFREKHLSENLLSDPFGGKFRRTKAPTQQQSILKALEPELAHVFKIHEVLHFLFQRFVINIAVEKSSRRCKRPNSMDKWYDGSSSFIRVSIFNT